jgi:hypothetical protein
MFYEYLYPEYYGDRNKCISCIIPRLEKKIKELETKLNVHDSGDDVRYQSSNEIQELKSNLRCKKIIFQSLKYYFGL